MCPFQPISFEVAPNYFYSQSAIVSFLKALLGEADTRDHEARERLGVSFWKHKMHVD